MKKRVLVCGDSFSILDEQHGHWVKYWCKNHHPDIEVDFCGLRGGSSVNCAMHLMAANLDLSEYSMAFVHLTDPLRVDQVKPEMSTPELTVARLDEVSSLDSMSFFEYVFRDREHGYAFESNLKEEKHIGHMYLGDQGIEDSVYNKSSCQWIAAANTLANRSVFQLLRSHDVTTVAVNTWWTYSLKDISHFMPEIQYSWHIPKEFTEWGEGHKKSDNHLNFDAAIEVAETWQRWFTANGLRI